ncbi:winged helix-turn-helix transcriptional regulator [Amycolatopsis sp. NPDC051372]|uniref:winged helix-turn-helix transcriptional regulator n=1 Tax=unclassified Amycolatopsis TaxID=2618356 RepID=UPI00343E36FA
MPFHGTDAAGWLYWDLKRSVAGISEKMLIQSLRELEHDGIVHREAYTEIPPRVEYSLTERGQALNTALLSLGEWGRDEHAPHRHHPRRAARARSLTPTR